MKKLTLNFNSGVDARDVWVDEDVLETYEEQFVTAYAKQKQWFNVSTKRKFIDYKELTFGEIETFTQSLPAAATLEENVLALNPSLGEVTPVFSNSKEAQPRFTRFTWVSLEEYVFDVCVERINAIISKEYGLV